jgi:hypothetical protein
MKHHADPDFWLLFDVLPKKVQKLARRNFALLKRNPKHPSLHFKRVGQYWSVRVGRDHGPWPTRLKMGCSGFG